MDFCIKRNYRHHWAMFWPRSISRGSPNSPGAWKGTPSSASFSLVGSFSVLPALFGGSGPLSGLKPGLTQTLYPSFFSALYYLGCVLFLSLLLTDCLLSQQILIMPSLLSHPERNERLRRATRSRLREHDLPDHHWAGPICAGAEARTEIGKPICLITASHLFVVPWCVPCVVF